MKFNCCWYLLPFCFLAIATNVHCEIVDQTTTTTTTTATKIAKACDGDQSIDIKIINRTSSIFKCQVFYDCDLKNHANTLTIFKDDKIVSQCIVKRVSTTGKEITKLEITCNLIMGYTGKNWKFVLGSKPGFNQTIGNETFIVTFDPLPLTKLPSFDITLDEEITSASILIPDCSHITETKYLNFQCSTDDDVKKPVNDNCQVTCPVKSDSTYNISLIRLPLPINNGKEIANGTFPEERRLETIRIGKPCHNAHSTAMKMMNRTSSIFMFNISYNCLIANSATLAVFKDGNIATQCKIDLTYLPRIENTNVILTCDNITKHAGQKWAFSFGSMNDHKTNVVNETFTVSLEPISFQSLPKFQLTVDENITLATIVVDGCNRVAEMTHLYFQCALGGIEKQSLSENCTFTCSVEPARNHHVQVIRSSIPKYDGAQTPNGTFLEEVLPVTFATKPDKATNIHFELSETNDTVALIYFTRPRGFFDEIRIDCVASDQTCTNTSASLTGKINSACTNCTHITIAPIQNGTEYKCWANISRATFSSINYSAIDFNTPLKPVLYKQTWLSNTTDISVDIIPQSDFDHIESVCQAQHTQPSVCMDMKITHSQCTTTLISTFNGIPGCDYRCFFSTVKEGYIDVHSEEYTMSIPLRQKKKRSLLWLISIPIVIIFLLGVGYIVWKRKTLLIRHFTSRRSRSDDIQAEVIE